MRRHLLGIAFFLVATAALVVGQLPDNIAPQVTIASPAMDAGVSGTVVVRADAFDNVSVTQVQFLLDLQNLGAADTQAPFEVEWDTTTASSGAHTLSAIAVDAAGNIAPSELVVVVVCGASVQPCPTPQPVPPPPSNQPPVANGDSITSTNGAPVTITAALLLQNDTDPENQVLSVTNVAPTTAQGGTVVANPDNSWTYAPRVGFSGTDTFGYVVSDGAATAIGTITATVTAAPPPPPPPTSSLVAHLTFDEASGTQATDMSGRGNNGVISGAQRVTGVSGGALQFDGVNDWVTVADAASLDLTTAFTLEAWVRLSAGGAWRTVVLKEGSGFSSYELYANNPDVSAPSSFFTPVGAAARSVHGTSALPTSSWTHLAATYDGANMRLYVNGALVRSVARTGTIRTSGGALRIGGNQTWGGEWFAGTIDEVRVYNRALTATEIGTDMNSTPPPAPVNRAPSAGADTLSTTTDSSVPFTAAYLLLNDSDPDGDPVSVTSVAATSAQGGTITSGSAGSWTYTPAPGMSGADSFTYVIGDGRSGSATGTVNVTVNGPAPPPPSGNGLVVALGFNESAGTTAGDSSGNGNAGTVREAQFVPGRFGNGLQFDGVNDWVTIADAASLDLTSSFTLEAWVRLDAGGAWRTVVLKEGSGFSAYELYANNPDVSAPSSFFTPVGATARSVHGTSALPTNTWTHLAATYDGANMRLYVNGALVRSVARTGTIRTSGGALRIGGNQTWGGEWFAGTIDEVRVYNRALSASEIQSDMLTPINP